VHISLPTEVEQPVVELVAQVAARHGVERISYISGAPSPRNSAGFRSSIGSSWPKRLSARAGFRTPSSARPGLWRACRCSWSRAARRSLASTRTPTIGSPPRITPQNGQ
jgi:hypothetical protein